MYRYSAFRGEGANSGKVYSTLLFFTQNALPVGHTCRGTPRVLPKVRMGT